MYSESLIPWHAITNMNNVYLQYMVSLFVQLSVYESCNSLQQKAVPDDLTDMVVIGYYKSFTMTRSAMDLYERRNIIFRR